MTAHTEPRQPAVEDRLRDDIDSGRTGDKVDHPDPAAAPLGSDAEAGGAPTPTPAAKDARDTETATPKDSRRRRGTGALIGFAVVVLAIIVAAVLIGVSG